MPWSIWVGWLDDVWWTHVVDFILCYSVRCCSSHIDVSWLLTYYTWYSLCIHRYMFFIYVCGSFPLPQGPPSVLFNTCAFECIERDTRKLLPYWYFMRVLIYQFSRCRWYLKMKYQKISNKPLFWMWALLTTKAHCLQVLIASTLPNPFWETNHAWFCYSMCSKHDSGRTMILDMKSA